MRVRIERTNERGWGTSRWVESLENASEGEKAGAKAAQKVRRRRDDQARGTSPGPGATRRRRFGLHAVPKSGEKCFGFLSGDGALECSELPTGSPLNARIAVPCSACLACCRGDWPLGRGEGRSHARVDHLDGIGSAVPPPSSTDEPI